MMRTPIILVDNNPVKVQDWKSAGLYFYKYAFKQFCYKNNIFEIWMYQEELVIKNNIFEIWMYQEELVIKNKSINCTFHKGIK